VIEVLFLNNKPFCLRSCPICFKKKVLLAMKLRYLKLTGHGMYSGDVVSGDEVVSAVDYLAIISGDAVSFGQGGISSLMRLRCGRLRRRQCPTF
jgi:hypothetical protein